MAQRSEIVLLISDLVLDELQEAPQAVRKVLDELSEGAREFVMSSEESLRLRTAYLAAKVVGPGSAADAHHVALATIVGADMIVSWNFKHIVHFDKIRGFNGVNLLQGYREIQIYSPQAVVP